MSVSLTVKHGNKTYKVELSSSEARIVEVKQIIEREAGIIVRNQKLIYKGKLLADSISIRESGCGSGAKLMLMAAGAKVPTETLKTTKEEVKNAPRIRETINWNQRRNTWSKSGVISTRQESLSILPDDLFTGSTAEGCNNDIVYKIADLSHNRLQVLPKSLVFLTNLRTLKLEHNCFGSYTSPAQGSTALEGQALVSIQSLEACLEKLVLLRCLSLDHNDLSILPSKSFKYLTKLEDLDLSYNGIEEIPPEVSHLVSLRRLYVDSNRLTALPQGLGVNMPYLEEFSAHHNRITGIPSSFGLHSSDVSSLALAPPPASGKDEHQPMMATERNQAEARAASAPQVQLGVKYGASPLSSEVETREPVDEAMSSCESILGSGGSHEDEARHRAREEEDGASGTGSKREEPSTTCGSADMQPRPATAGGVMPTTDLNPFEATRREPVPAVPGLPFSRLKKFELSFNMISSLPRGFFIRLSALRLLGLHNNPITVEVLREAEGFAEYDERRQALVNKAIDGKLNLEGAARSEGADGRPFSRFWAGDEPPSKK